MNKDIENNYIHCNVEHNLPNDALQAVNVLSGNTNPENTPFLVIGKVDNELEWNISGKTNNAYDDREGEVYIHAVVDGEAYDSPRMTIRQHKKPNSNTFKGATIEKSSGEAEGNGTSVTFTAKGGRAIVSASACTNNDCSRPVTNRDYFNLRLFMGGNGFIRQIGSSQFNSTKQRMEWVVEVQRNDYFSDRNCLVYVDFLNEDGKVVASRTLTINQEAKLHTYDNPILTIGTTDISNSAHTVNFDCYYLIDNSKQPVDKFEVYDTQSGWINIENVGQYPSLAGLSKTYNNCKGVFTIPVNISNTTKEWKIRGVVTNADILTHLSSEYTNEVSIWQEGVPPVGYSFNVTMPGFPSKALLTLEGIKTWHIHVPYDIGSVRIAIHSTKDVGVEGSEYFYQESWGIGETDNSKIKIETGGDGESAISSHQWSTDNSNEYIVNINDFTGIAESGQTRQISLTFTQKNDSSTELKKFRCIIEQCDASYKFLYRPDKDNVQPNYYLLTLGSDLLTGRGLNAYASVSPSAGGTEKVGDSVNVLGDDTNMSLLWGGKNSNIIGNQYLVFSPTVYTTHQQNDIKLTVQASTMLAGPSTGDISLTVESLKSKPNVIRSNRIGIKNVITSTGTVYKKEVLHCNINASKTTILEIQKFYSDNSCCYRQIPSTIPHYSIDANRVNTLSHTLVSGVEKGNIPASVMESQIKGAVYAASTPDSYEAVLNTVNDGSLMVATNIIEFKKLELFYEKSKYRLWAIRVEPQGNADPFYCDARTDEDYEKFTGGLTGGNSGLIDGNYKFYFRKWVFIFELVDEVNEMEAGLIERSAYIYNPGLGANEQSGNIPTCEFKGKIYDKTTRLTSDFTISSDTGGKRKLTWTDVSNGSSDASKKLSIISIDKIDDGKLSQSGKVWLFQGFRNGSDGESGNITRNYTSMENFQYAYNSSTSRLELGFQYDTGLRKMNTRFTGTYDANYAFMMVAGTDTTRYTPFEDARIWYNFYRWTGDSNGPSSEVVKTIFSNDNPVSEYLVELEDTQNSEQAVDIDNCLKSAPSFDLYLQEDVLGLPDDTILFMRFLLKDKAINRKRAIYVARTTLGRFRSNNAMNVYWGPVASGTHMGEGWNTGNLQNAWVFYSEWAGAGVSMARE